MRIVYHEYANEADDNVPKPAQSLSTPVPRQKLHFTTYTEEIDQVYKKAQSCHANMCLTKKMAEEDHTLDHTEDLTEDDNDEGRIEVNQYFNLLSACFACLDKCYS